MRKSKDYYIRLASALDEDGEVVLKETGLSHLVTDTKYQVPYKETNKQWMKALYLLRFNPDEIIGGSNANFLAVQMVLEEAKVA